MDQYLHVDEDDFKTVSSDGKIDKIITGDVNHCVAILAFSVEGPLTTITLGHFASAIGRREKLVSFLEHLPTHHCPDKTLIATFGGQMGVIEDENPDYLYDSSEMLRDVKEGLAKINYKISYEDVLVKNRHIQRLSINTKGKVAVEMGVFGLGRQIPATYTRHVSLSSNPKTNFVAAWLQSLTAPTMQFNYSGFFEPSTLKNLGVTR